MWFQSLFFFAFVGFTRSSSNRAAASLRDRQHMFTAKLNTPPLQHLYTGSLPEVPCPPNATYPITYNTPTQVSNQITISFSGMKPNAKYTNVAEWQRFPRNGECKGARTNISYCATERRPVPNIQTPCNLSAGEYIWIITNDSQMTFGHVINRLEFGNKHLALAFHRAVYSAGELLVHSNGNISWNLASGTFSRGKEAILFGPTSEVWNSTVCRNKIFYDKTPLIFPPETFLYINELCQNYSRLRSSVDWNFGKINAQENPCVLALHNLTLCSLTAASSTPTDYPNVGLVVACVTVVTCLGLFAVYWLCYKTDDKKGVDYERMEEDGGADYQPPAHASVSSHPYNDEL